MERADLEQWRAREVARLLTLVETQRRYYQEIVASVPVGLLVLSSDLAIILANAAARTIFGWTTGESMQRRLDALLPAWLLGRVGEVLTTGVPLTGLTLEIEREPKKRVRVGILAIRNWDDDMAREALLTVEDLTDVSAPAAAGVQPAAEIAPAEAAGEITAPSITAYELVDNVDAVMWALKVATKEFIFVSRQAEKLLGFPASHWIEQPAFWTERIHPVDRDRVLASYQRTIDHGEPHAGEFRAVTADGRLCWLRETARLLSDHAGNPEFLVGITVDVTERRLVERQLAQAERVEAVSKLASRMAHDLNNMLMVLTGYGEELLNGLPAASSLRADVQEVLGAAERMSGLTSQLLAFARRPSVLLEPLAIEAALGGLAHRLSTAAGADVSLEVKPNGEQNYIKTNLGQLEQVLSSLVQHVARVMLPGASISLEASRLEIHEGPSQAGAPLRQGDYIVIDVTAPRRIDAGEAHPVAFESFLNGKNPSDDTSALAHAYGMVRQWGGDLAVLDEPGESYGFRVFVERVEITREGAETAEAQPAAAPEPQMETILVVEDEAGIRALVRKILRRQGYLVIEAMDGAEALEKRQEHGGHVDLVITDMMMPRMGGRELVERLHEQDPAIKVLYVSGYTDDAAILARDLPPGTGFLQKPFTLGSLLEKVKDVLSAK